LVTLVGPYFSFVYFLWFFTYLFWFALHGHAFNSVGNTFQSSHGLSGVWVLVHCLDGFSAVFSPHRLHMDLGDFCLNLYLLLPGCWMDLMLLSCDICASTPHVRSRPVNAAKKDTRCGDCIGWWWWCWYCCCCCSSWWSGSKIYADNSVFDWQMDGVVASGEPARRMRNLTSLKVASDLMPKNTHPIYVYTHS